MGKLKEYKNAKNSKKFEHMKKIINFYAHKGEELRPDLEPYVFLLLVDFKFIKKKFPIKHDPETNDTSIDRGEQLPFDDSKRGYIEKLAYQQILETTYGGMSGESVASLKKWLMARHETDGKISLKKWDTGSIVRLLSSIEPLEYPFDLDLLLRIFNLFDDAGTRREV